MSGPLLICTDLDRTLIPNGLQPESAGARHQFAALVARPEVSLAYVSGRHSALVQEAIANFGLPTPDFVVGDVGSTMYRVGPEQVWQRMAAWETEIGQDWAGCSHADLHDLLRDLPDLRPQESAQQNRFKLSFYVLPHSEHEALEAKIRDRLDPVRVKANLIWSVDDLKGIGLLDILPARASKVHAVRALMNLRGFECARTVFCGDSGNDMEVLASSIPAVLVANAREDVRESARRLADEKGHGDRLYCARGGFMGMNGNYSAGILEGVAHFHPQTRDWMAFKTPGESV